MDKRKGLIYVFLFSLAWAIQTIINKFAVNQGVDPIVFSYQTLFGAALIFVLYFLVFGGFSFKNLNKKLLPRLSLVGLLGSGLATILTFYSLQYSTSVNFGFIVKTTTIFSVLLAAIFLKEKLSFKKIFFVFLMFFGVYLISTAGEVLVPRVGDFLILLTALCLASGNIIARPLLRTYTPEIVAFSRTIIGGLIVLMFVPFFVDQFWIVEDLFLVAIRSLFVFLTLLFLNKTIKATNVSYMSMMSMMYSVFVLILGYIAFGESFNYVQIFGAILISVSVIFIQKIKGIEG